MKLREGTKGNFSDIKIDNFEDGVEVEHDETLKNVIDGSLKVKAGIKNTSGSTIKGRGVGGLLVEINTNGKFDMWGDFSVFEGVYNFAYGGIVGKQFIVQPGGTLAWEGDPLSAMINIEAIYKTQANPSPLLDNPINNSN